MSAPAAPYTHRATRAVQRLVEYAPATGSLALWVHHQDDDSVGADVLVRNDGRALRYGAAFAQMTLERQTGLVAQEVLHIALRHVPRFHALQRRLGDVDLPLYTLAADALVVSTLGHLDWLEVDARAVRVETLVERVLGEAGDASQALLRWDVESLYRALDDRRPPGGRKRGDGPAKPGRRSGAGRSPQRALAAGERARKAKKLGENARAHLVPAAGPERPEEEAESARTWRERVLRGHAGDGEHSLLRALLADLPKVHTPWEQLLRTRLARGLAPQRARSWSRPSRAYLALHRRLGPGRRMPFEPGWSSQKAVARLAVMLDVSGSVDDDLLARFSSELAAITRRHEARAVVVVGDDRVRAVHHYAPGRTDLSQVEFRGGGDTDFSPLLEEADRWRPDVGVFLTDLKGPADHRPGFPVLWAVPRAHADQVPPFGRKLVLD